MATETDDEEEESDEETQERERQEQMLIDRRTQQLEQIRGVIPLLDDYATNLKTQHQKMVLLESVSAGLYDETDKLAKKAAVDEITDLALSQVNDLIREAKEFLVKDPYVQKYNEFVAAGNNPQYRDVVMVLRQIRQGLDRFQTTNAVEIKRAATLLSDAKGIRVALALFLKGEDHVSKQQITYNGEDVSSKWLNSSLNDFSFLALDRVNIPEHFGVEQ